MNGPKQRLAQQFTGRACGFSPWAKPRTEEADRLGLGARWAGAGLRPTGPEGMRLTRGARAVNGRRDGIGLLPISPGGGSEAPVLR